GGLVRPPCPCRLASQPAGQAPCGGILMAGHAVGAEPDDGGVGHGQRPARVGAPDGGFFVPWVRRLVHPTPRLRVCARAAALPPASYTPVASVRPRWRRAQVTSRRRRASSTLLARLSSLSSVTRATALASSAWRSTRFSAASLAWVDASSASTSCSSNARRSAWSAPSRVSRGSTEAVGCSLAFISAG